METGSSNGRRVRFGAFEADLQTGELRKSGIRVRLQDQPFRVLALLLERSGEVVSREDLRQEIWPDDTFVDFDHSLNTAINKIREALGDSASHPRFVETIPRRGYRFVFPVPRPPGKDAAEASVGPAPPGAPAARGILAKRKHLGWVIAAVATIGALAVGVAYFAEPSREQAEGPTPTTFYVHPPEGTTFLPLPMMGPPTISPNGQHLVFGGESKDGSRMLWHRPLDSVDAHSLAGTQDARYPFWSPDSRQVAFFADGKLKRLAIGGGEPRLVCDAPAGRGGAWSAGGTSGEEVILFAPLAQTGLHRVSPNGGEATPVTTLDRAAGELSHRRPTFLPDGEHFLYVVVTKDSAKEREGIYLAKIGPGSERPAQQGATGRRLLAGFAQVAYSPPIDTHPSGYILHVVDENLMAQPFDAGSLELTGKPFFVAASVAVDDNRRATADFSVSNTGSLVLGSTGSEHLGQLVWFDRAGGRLDVVGDSEHYAWVELSPDEGRVAFDVPFWGQAKNDISVLEFASGRRMQITSRPHFDGGPIWSPDGRRIAFHWFGDDAKSRIYLTASTGVGDPELLTDEVGLAWDWSSDGKYILRSRKGETTDSDLWVTPLDGDRASVPYLEEKFIQGGGQFSPNGQYVAYASNESGQFKVYVQPFPATGDKWPISVHGGVFPRWRGDGAELFYIASDGMLMSVKVQRGSSFAVGTPRGLFRTRIPAAHGFRPKYDVSADGQRFLINTLAEEQTAQPVTVMLNWQAGLAE